MNGFLENSAFFGVALSLCAYGLGVVVQKHVKCPLLNPLLVSAALIIALLVGAHIDYEVYNTGAKYLSYLLTPATVCLAVPLYEKLSLLRRDGAAVLTGVLAGVLTTLVSVLLLSTAFGLSHAEYVTLLPKSITTAIGMGVSEELGGHVTVTVAAIIATGMTGSTIAPGLCRLLKIHDPVAKGVAIGTASHAMGTSKAMEMGETEGAMSSLAIVVSGILTVAVVPLFSGLL